MSVVYWGLGSNNDARYVSHNLAWNTIWHTQSGMKHNLARNTIWHTPIWHETQSGIKHNLAHIIWHTQSGTQSGTKHNLAHNLARHEMSCACLKSAGMCFLMFLPFEPNLILFSDRFSLFWMCMSGCLVARQDLMHASKHLNDRQAGRQAWLFLLHFNKVRYPRWHLNDTYTRAHTHTLSLSVSCRFFLFWNNTYAHTHTLSLSLSCRFFLFWECTFGRITRSHVKDAECSVQSRQGVFVVILYVCMLS